MARWNPGSGTFVTYSERICSSATLLAVNRPVKKLLSCFTFATRASAALIHVALAVSVFAQAQAAAGFFAPLGMAQALPPTMLTGLPSWSVNGRCRAAGPWG